MKMNAIMIAVIAGTMLSMPVSAEWINHKFKLYTNIQWSPTNVYVFVGDGIWVGVQEVRGFREKAGPNLVDGRGFIGTPTGDKYTLPGAPHGALIGKIATGEDDHEPEIFFIGNQARIPTRKEGYLYLGVNDQAVNKGAAYTDNRGYMFITIGAD